MKNNPFLLQGLFAFFCAASGQAGNPALDDTQPSPVVEHRYKLEVIGFRCLDEAGYDSPFFAPWISDEVVVLNFDPDRRVWTLSKIFGDVDTGESRSFEPDESCILPIGSLSGKTEFIAKYDAWTCSGAGIPGPFGFTVRMFEEDGGFFHDCLSDFPPQLQHRRF